MRLNRLRYKIFFSFTAILLILGGLVLTLFRSSQYYDPTFQYMAKNAMLIQLILEEGGRDSLQKALDISGDYGRTRIWVTDNNGNVIARSFTGALPAEAANPDAYPSREVGNVRIHQVQAGDTEVIAITPVSLSGQPATLFLSNQLRAKETPEQFFLRGLASVLLAGLVLVFLVTWFISRPLRKVRKAVTAMAGGQLSVRVKADSADELGELSRAFNQMAESLERMIRGSCELLEHFTFYFMYSHMI